MSASHPSNVAQLSPRRKSIRTRLVLWNIATLALLLGVFGFVTHLFVRSFMLGAVDRELIGRTQRLIDRPPPPDWMRPPDEGLGRAPDRRDFGRGRGGPDGTGGPRGRDMHLFDLTGQALRPGDSAAPPDATTRRRAAAGDLVFANGMVDGEPARVLVRRFPGRGAPMGVVQASIPLTEVNRAASELDRALLLLAPVAILFAGLGGLQLTRHVLAPVRRLMQAAARIGAADLSARLTVVGQDEFAELGATFNGMLGRLETAFEEQQRLVEQQRRFVADASHELRTPLTVIKGNASLCLSGSPAVEEYRACVEEMNRAADAMSRLVQDLLMLARADADRLGHDRIALPVREALQRAASGLRRTACPARIDVPDTALCVLGNEDEVTRLFANLLDNAARYTPADGSVCVSASREDDLVRVTIADTGIGIAPDHLVHLGERFYRADQSRTRGEGGSGLGLSICKSIVEAHGGSIAFESVVGRGTTVTVRLPVDDGA